MIESKKLPANCQLHTIPKMSIGLIDLGPMPLRKKMKFWLKQNLDAKTKKRAKRIFNNLPFKFFSNSSQEQKSPSACIAPNRILVNSQSETKNPDIDVKAGDLVRIRSTQEINSTLDGWNEFKGCMFMPDMWQYCGTTQRVFKVVEQFVDERDYRLKKGRGILLLEGLICEGTPDYGRCDRACFYFWREEWLEKIP